MGRCQSRPEMHEPELSCKPSVHMSHSYLEKLKNHPSEQFATPCEQIPKLTKQVEQKLQKLGPFKFQNCGKYSSGAQLQPYRLKNGSVYVGQWKQGKINGKGKYYLPDHSLFEGISVDNEISGLGRIIHENGDYFQGQLQNGKANGQGIYVEGNITYEGPFKDNLQHGQGIQYSDLYQFKGLFSQGSKQKGRLILKNKDKYEYNGQFKNNRYDGQGVIINEIGKYEGQFENGAKNGYGKFTWTDKSYYEGEYKNDQKNGKGKLYDKHGKLIRQETWQNSQILN